MKRVALLSLGLLLPILILSQSSFADCDGAFILCSKETVTIENLQGSGIDDDLSGLACHPGDFPETNSIWFKWRVESPGDLGFTLLPLDENDDLDFILFRMDGGMDNCGQRLEIRCMASGKNRGEIDESNPGQCVGATGLNNLSTDAQEASGCGDSDNNFLADIEVLAGEEYALFINNYYSNGGFLMEFIGSAGFADLGSSCRNGGATPVSLDLLSEGTILIGEPYPNPAQDELFLPITSEKDFPEARLQLINSQGSVVHQELTNIVIGEQRHAMSLGGLPIGIYFLKATIGDEQYIVRFHKQ